LDLSEIVGLITQLAPHIARHIDGKKLDKEDLTIILLASIASEIKSMSEGIKAMQEELKLMHLDIVRGNADIKELILRSYR